MTDQYVFTIRAKQIGVLLRQARIKAGKSMKEVGSILGMSGGMISAFENGLKSPSLAELEAFAYIYEVPIEFFVEGEAIEEKTKEVKELDWKLVLPLRNKIIGAKICQARLDQGKTLKDLAQVTGVNPRTLRAFELGNKPVPFPLLEKLMEELNLTSRELLVKEGVVGEYFLQQKALRNFTSLPLDLQEFVSQPVNQPYLELAKKLSELDVNKLRQVAEVLLEITF